MFAQKFQLSSLSPSALKAEQAPFVPLASSSQDRDKPIRFAPDAPAPAAPSQTGVEFLPKMSFNRDAKLTTIPGASVEYFAQFKELSNDVEIYGRVSEVLTASDKRIELLLEVPPDHAAAKLVYHCISAPTTEIVVGRIYRFVGRIGQDIFRCFAFSPLQGGQAELDCAKMEAAKAKES